MLVKLKQDLFYKHVEESWVTVDELKNAFDMLIGGFDGWAAHVGGAGGGRAIMVKSWADEIEVDVCYRSMTYYVCGYTFYISQNVLLQLKPANEKILEFEPVWR